jgi:hypothetical protein
MTMPPAEMSERELLDRAREAMLRAAALPPGSLARSVQWGLHDTYMAELRVRASAALLNAMRKGGRR